MTDILPPAGWLNVRQLETNEFATGGANGNMNEQAKSLAARSELLKQYAALPYESKTGGYALNERVQLATGDIVKSTVVGNLNDPNTDMTGWVKTNSAGQIFDASGKNQQELNTNLSFKYSLLHDSISQSLHKKLGERVSVVDFGAVGDGVTDDTTAFQRAVNSGHKIFMPAGRYLLDTVYLDRAGLFLEGESSLDTILIAKESSGYVLDVLYGTLGKISNFQIIGNNIKDGGIRLGCHTEIKENSQNPVTATSTHFAGILENIYIHEFKNPNSGHGLNLSKVQNTEVKGCFIVKNTVGVYRPNLGYCTSTKFSGFSGKVGNNENCSFLIEGWVTDFAIDGLIMEGNKKGAIKVLPTAVGVTTGSKIALRGCYFELNTPYDPENEYSVISVHGKTGAGSTMYQVQTLSISDCFFAYSGTGAPRELDVSKTAVTITDSNIYPSRIFTTSDVSLHYRASKSIVQENIIPIFATMAGSITVSASASVGGQLNQMTSLTIKNQGRRFDTANHPNMLDAYERMDWTPTIKLLGQTSTINSATASYTLIGDMLYFNIYIAVNNLKTTHSAQTIVMPYIANYGSVASMFLVPAVAANIAEVNRSMNVLIYTNQLKTATEIFLPTLGITGVTNMYISGHYRVKP